MNKQDLKNLPNVIRSMASVAKTMNKHTPGLVYEKIGHHDAAIQRQCYSVWAAVPGTRGQPIATFYDVAADGYNASNQADALLAQLEVATETGFGPRQLADKVKNYEALIGAGADQMLQLADVNQKLADALTWAINRVDTSNLQGAQLASYQQARAILAKCGKVGG